MPHDIEIIPASDRSTTIRASLRDTERTLVIAVLLVTLIVFLFIGDLRAALIPAIAVPVSIIGTFATMYLLGYSLDNLSLMALTIATGFVVDDAIVVLENIERYIEEGVPRREAALRGAREVGFTVISISISLIAVFIPLLLMGGVVGRLFREFSVTLSMAIVVSLVISLTTTPMLCALLLKSRPRNAHPRRSLFTRIVAEYGRSVTWALRHRLFIMSMLLSSVVLTIVLFTGVPGIFEGIPKGFFPEQDTGRLQGSIQADQSISFQSMSVKLDELVAIVGADPAVDVVTGNTGSGSGGGAGSTNSGSVSIQLKPLSERTETAGEVVARLRRKLSRIAGARLIMQPVQDLRIGGRQSNALYQYTLQADNSTDLYNWAPKLVQQLQKSSVVLDVNTDQQQNGIESDIVIDRDTTSRLGLTPAQIDNTLYDAFGQRQVSTIYSDLNQYHVIMEVAPRYWQDPSSLRDVYVSTSGGPASGTATSVLPVGTVVAKSSASAASAVANASVASARNAATNAIANSGKGGASSGAAVSTAIETMVPLTSFVSYKRGSTALAINHQGPFVVSTISFNLAVGSSLSEAAVAIDQAIAEIRMPASVHGGMQGTARTFQKSLDSEPLLIAAALVAVYIVLGILYESYIHPITILSTLPSAGVGALLALLICDTEFSIVAFIGVILLIGIVKKNAIMMIDFAIEAQRVQGLSEYDAILQACQLRFRPIMMTTAAAILGAVPLALSYGDGGEIRRPLGIAIVGGLVVSQLLTLYTTPVLYLIFSDLRDTIANFFRPGLLSRLAR
jgi:multidrug efflux pump